MTLRWLGWGMAFLLALSLGHCLPAPFDASCAACPCPTGYVCVQGQFCLKQAQVDQVATICQPYLNNETTSPDGPQPDTSSTGLVPLHARCTLFPYAPANERCGAGLRCVRVGLLRAFCLQDCSTSPDICTGKRSVCRQIGWSSYKSGPISICVEEQQQAGASCDHANSLYCRRGTGSNHLMCMNNTCQQARLIEVNNLSCDPTLTGLPTECDVTAGLTCNNQKICVQGLRAREGEACGATMKTYCLPGLTCARLDNVEPVCLRTCQAVADCGDPLAFTCIQDPQGNKGCVQVGCKHYSDCSFTSPPHNCISSTYLGKPVGECRAFPATGAGVSQLGGSCDNVNKFCQYPLNCMSLLNSPSPFCVPSCRTDGDCLRDGLQGTCEPLESGVGVCVWSCPDQTTCPQGLRCQDTGGGAYFCGGQ